MNLATCIWGEAESRITLRRLCSLAFNLPMHGAVGSARGALAAQSWRQGEELLATIADLLHLHWRTFVMANSKKGARPPNVWRYPRPYEQAPQPTQKRPATNEELEAMFGPRRNA